MPVPREDVHNVYQLVKSNQAKLPVSALCQHIRAAHSASYETHKLCLSSCQFFQYVEKLNEEGISLVRRIGGVEIFRLEHRFGQMPEGASYKSTMTVGVASGLFRGLFNSVVQPRVFSDAMGTAWLTHNVEEVSMFESILPALYAAR